MAASRMLLPLMALVLSACGGGNDDSQALISVPGTPSNLSITIGEQSIAMSWSVPDYDGGAPIQSYLVTVESITPNRFYSFTETTTRTNTTVEVDLQPGVQYSIGVAAQNRVGAGLPASAAITPSAPQPAAYTPLKIEGDTSPNGIFDPSVIRLSNGQVWMAYSSVNYYKDAANNLVQDVGIRLARSDDGGKTFRFASIIATPEPATITDTDPKLRACGAPTCTGRWVYETAWLVEDATDPDPARRFKLFAHQYFLNPSGSASTLYHLGAIVMWTASALHGTWSAPTAVLGSMLSPPELGSATYVNALHADLSSCIAVSEGGANVRDGTLDIVLTCVTPSDVPLLPLPQKIVLLRTTDHARTFQYVSTLLTPEDAKALGPVYFTAPALVAVDGTPSVLIATPAADTGIYVGCSVFPIEDQDAGTLVRKDNIPVRLLNIPPVATHFGGACAWDRGLGTHGILISDVTLGATKADTKFNILATGRAL